VSNTINKISVAIAGLSLSACTNMDFWIDADRKLKAGYTWTLVKEQKPNPDYPYIPAIKENGDKVIYWKLTKKKRGAN